MLPNSHLTNYNDSGNFGKRHSILFLCTAKFSLKDTFLCAYQKEERTNNSLDVIIRKYDVRINLNFLQIFSSHYS